MFIAVLFTVAKTTKTPRVHSVGEWIKKRIYIHSGILLRHKKQGNPLLFVTTWMDLESIMLSEIKKTDQNCMVSFICGILSDQNKPCEFTEKEKRACSYQGRIGERGELEEKVVKGTNFQS